MVDIGSQPGGAAAFSYTLGCTCQTVVTKAGLGGSHIEDDLEGKLPLPDLGLLGQSEKFSLCFSFHL